MSAAGPTTMYLARHGQSLWNNQALITGQVDIDLSPKGRDQAAAIGRCLAGEPLDAVYASQLRRAVDTARPAADARGLPVTPLPGLAEIHMGVLQGRLRDERDPEAQAIWAAWQADLWNYQVPGGERFDAFVQRVSDALAELLARHAGQHLLVVGHRATNRVLLGLLFGWPRERWLELKPRNKFLYRLRIQPGAEPVVDTYLLGGSRVGTLEPGFVT